MYSNNIKSHQERRVPLDRRKRTTIWGCLRFGGRRRAARREGEGHNRYVDQPSRRVLILVGLIYTCSIVDALSTLLYFEHGGSEANPILAAVIPLGHTWFVAFKMLLTFIGSTMLAIHQNFRLGLSGLYTMAVIYIGLLLYHGILWLDRL